MQQIMECPTCNSAGLTQRGNLYHLCSTCQGVGNICVENKLNLVEEDRAENCDESYAEIKQVSKRGRKRKVV